MRPRSLHRDPASPRGVSGGGACRRLIGSALLAASACAPGEQRASDSARTADVARDAASAECYVSASSLLGREAAPARGLVSEQVAPPDSIRGWLRLERGTGAGGGSARIADSDGAALGATWRRVEGDSLLVIGFDDFLRVELRLASDADSVRGSAVASSDAAFDRGSDDRLVEYRREWTVTAAPAPCAGLPALHSRDGA